jgi:YVTN family beta-propeller protein
VALTPDGSSVYVTNQQDSPGDVSVISTSSGLVAGAVTVGSTPLGVAVSPASPYYSYIANSQAGTVSVINTATKAVVSTITVGGTPVGVAINPAGTYVYVTSEASGVVSVISTSSETVVGTIDVGGYPVGIAVDPANPDTLYVTNSETGTVSVISASLGEVTGDVTVGTNPLAVAFSPNGAYAYVVNNQGTPSLISPAPNSTANGTVRSSAGAEYRANGEIIPDTTFGMVLGPSIGSLSVIKTATQSVVNTITVGYAPVSLALTPNGAYAYVSDSDGSQGGGAVSVVNTAANSTIYNLTGVYEPEGIAISSDGTYGYVADAYTALVWRFATDSYDSQSITTSTTSTSTSTVTTTIGVAVLYGINTNANIIAGTSPTTTSTSLPSGYPYYLCAGSTGYWPPIVVSWNTSSGYGAEDTGPSSAVGYMTSNSCTLHDSGYSAVAIMGVNAMAPDSVYTANNVEFGSSIALDYTVTGSNAFVIIGAACGAQGECNPISLPSGCTVQQDVNGPEGLETAFFATCSNQASGNYSVQISSTYDYGLSAMAYVYNAGGSTTISTTSTSTTSSSSSSTSTSSTSVSTTSTTLVPPALTGNIALTGWPFQVVFAPNTNYAYVSDSNYADVYVVNTISNSLSTTISIGSYSPSCPCMAASPDGSHVYVPTSSGLQIISTSTNTRIGIATLAGATDGPQSPGNVTYASNGSDDASWPFSLLRPFEVTWPDPTFPATITTTIPVKVPYDVAVSPSGAFAYVPYGLGSAGGLDVISTQTNAEVLSVPLNYYDDLIATPTTGSYAYVGDSPNESVAILNMASNAIVNVLGVGGGLAEHGIAESPNGAYGFALGPSGLTVINTSTESVTNTIYIGNNPISMAVSKSGKYVYVATENCSVEVVSPTVNAILTSFVIVPGESTCLSTGLAISPSGTYGYAAQEIYYTDINVFKTNGYS